MNNELDESKLTAYALGEIADENERRAIEARLADDPDARAEIEQVREVAGLLKDQLAAEPMPDPSSESIKLPAPRPRRKWLEHALAACIVLGICGVLVAILLPAMRAARYSRSSFRTYNPTSAPQPATRPPFDNSLRYSEQPSTSTIEQSRTVGDLKAQARRLIAEGRYQEALGVVDQVRKIDPRDDYAAGVRPLVQDKALLQQQRQYREDFDRQFTKQLNEAEEKKVPYDDVLRYPSNWPDLKEVSASATATDTRLGAAAGANALASRNSREWDRDGDLDGIAKAYPLRNGSPRHTGQFNTEAYARIVDNPFLDVAANPLSTFSIDVDTASYSNMRRFLQRGQLPPKDSVRIEELLNYFPYDYAPPAKHDEKPFASNVEIAACPWEPKHRLVRVALKGKEIAADKRPASNLVFLIDVSGSMNEPNKLPLVKQSLRMLTEKLNGEDRVAMVVYAGNSGLVLPSTSCREGSKQSILNALDSLEAGGSTNGASGITLAYQVAQQNFIKGGTNRVILCTDGDFNVGITSDGDLTRLIEDKARGGVFLSVLGFGMGNLKDSMMERLADKGNGNYAYIDTATEAKKLLVEQMSGTLVTIAKDVKIQVEFNPAVVGSYRLIGYEDRLLAKEDFNDDKKDAGEIGAGHAVTALYEVVPAGAKSPTTTTPAAPVDPLKYQKPTAVPWDAKATDEMLTLKLRYKQPDGETSKLLEFPVKDPRDATFAKASTDFKFASAVAAFGMILRDSPHKGSANYSAVLEWAQDGLGADTSGYRAEFIELVKKAKTMAQK